MYFFSRLDSLLCAADSTIIARILVCMCVYYDLLPPIPFDWHCHDFFFIIGCSAVFYLQLFSVCVLWCLVAFMHSIVLFAHNHSFSCTLIPESQHQ